MGIRTLIKLAVFLALLAVFLLVEYRLRGSGRVPGPAALAVLVAASLFCSALLSQIVGDAFAPVWEELEESGDAPEKSRDAPVESGDAPVESGDVPVESGDVPEDAQSKAAQPEDTQPKATQPEDTQPKATQPEDTQPKAAQPKAAQPKAAQPKAAQPEEVQPEEAQPKATGVERTAKNLPDYSPSDKGEEELLFEIEEAPVPMSPYGFDSDGEGSGGENPGEADGAG